MKKILLFTLFSLGFFASLRAQVSVNVNIGAAPAWAPVGYEEVEYYYLPDIGVYYDRPRAVYIYPSNGKWIRVKKLPPAYRGYNPYRGHTVVLTDYHGHAPYTLYEVHKVKYKKGYSSPPRGVKGHPHGKSKGHGHVKGHGKH
ncbi:MAG TPA: hypothetical protein VK183_10775 [Flavobacterium sp.]|nr:hypothetical protein [Flavobacterium sp.]